MPASASNDSQAATAPILFRCGPDMIKAFFPPSFAATSGSFLIVPFPATIFCGTENENSSIFLISPYLIYFPTDVEKRVTATPITLFSNPDPT